MENKDVIISVYQINGMLSHKLEIEGEKEKVLDLSNLNKGIYILSVYGINTLYKQKFIVQ